MKLYHDTACSPGAGGNPVAMKEAEGFSSTLCIKTMSLKPKCYNLRDLTFIIGGRGRVKMDLQAPDGCRILLETSVSMADHHFCLRVRVGTPLQIGKVLSPVPQGGSRVRRVSHRFECFSEY